MSSEFVQGPGKEFVESRAMERNASGLPAVLKWRLLNGFEITSGLRERVIHNYNGLNHHHSLPVTSPVHHLPFNLATLATGVLTLPGTGLRRVAIRARGVAAKIPVGTFSHEEGQAQHHRYGTVFRVAIGQHNQVGGHTAILNVSYMPDIPGPPAPIEYIMARPTENVFSGATIGLNTFEDEVLGNDSDKAFKMDRIIYFSVNGSASIQQRDTLGWLRHKAGGPGGVYEGGTADTSGDLTGVPLGTFLDGYITRNEDGLNLTSLERPYGLMFANPINSIGMDVKILGWHRDTIVRPVEYRELQAI